MIRYEIEQLLALAPHPFEPAIDFDGLLPAFDLGLWTPGAGRETFERMFDFYNTVPPYISELTTEHSHLPSATGAYGVDAIASLEVAKSHPVRKSVNTRPSARAEVSPAPPAKVRTAQDSTLLKALPVHFAPPLNGSGLHDRPIIAGSSVPIDAAVPNLAHGTQPVGRKSILTKVVRPHTASTAEPVYHERPALASVKVPVKVPLPSLVHESQPVISTASVNTPHHVASTSPRLPLSHRYTDDHTLNHIVNLALDDTQQWPLPGVDENNLASTVTPTDTQSATLTTSVDNAYPSATVNVHPAANVPTALAAHPPTNLFQASPSTKRTHAVGTAPVNNYANADISREHQRLIEEGHEVFEGFRDATDTESINKVYYQAITYMPEYRHFSFEELHLQNISTGLITAASSNIPQPPRLTWTTTPATILVTPREVGSTNRVPSSTTDLLSSVSEVAIIEPDLIVQPNQALSATHGRRPATTLEAVPSGVVYDRMVTIVVTHGMKTQTFEVYQGLLGYYSDHFHSAIATFKASGHSSISVENVEIPTFTMFTTWMNQRKFRLSQLKPDSELAWTTIFRMWAFAEQYGVPMMQNYAINVYIEKAAEVYSQPWVKPTARDILYAYEITSSGSKLRKVIVDSVNLTTRAGRKVLGRDGAFNDFPPEFLFDLLQVVAKRPPQFATWDQEKFRNIFKCQYHNHPRHMKCMDRQEDMA